MPKRPCWVEVRTQSLEDNYRFLQSLVAPGVELLAIVKADAYGHSLALCAPAAIRAGARWLGVTSVEEGATARMLCPQAEILVIGGVFPGQGPAVVEHRLTAVAWEPWQLDELESAARAAAMPPSSLPIHLEIDTGMSRQGLSPDQLHATLPLFVPDSPLKLDGVMTHLYAADEANGAVTEAQLEQMSAVLHRVEDAGIYPDWLNIGASAALVAGQAAQIAELADRHGMKTMLRPGLVLYGLTPSFHPAFDSPEPPTLTAARAHLRPVMSWKTRVTSLRAIPAGAVVGYNGTFVATEPMRLALLAVGYADGLDRRLGNRFSLLIRGQRAPIVGRISMDQTVVDVTEIPSVEPGDEVVILGEQGEESISAIDHADALETIPWEVFTRIGRRVRRVAV